MNLDLQRASIWKRAAAGLLDVILLCIVATMFMWILSMITGYESKNEKLNSYYRSYETEYGIQINISAEDYGKLSDEELLKYEQAEKALYADTEVMQLYSALINLTLLITSIGIFFACFLLEFVVPLILRNGQTVGKKIFSVGVMAVNGVRVTPMMMFVRSILGKYTVELMIPVALVLMIFTGVIGWVGIAVIGLLLLLNLGLLIFTRNHSMIHDAFSYTVAIDFASQRIFENADELLAYRKRVAAERADKQDY